MWRDDGLPPAAEEGGVRCAIYTRLSKEDQDRREDGSESIRNQRSLLLRYAAEQGWEVYRVYCDEDRSGADGLRPDFNRMLQEAEEGRFQVILCKSQSRFTRDMELVEKYIHGLFPRWGVRFIALADNADTAARGNKKARQINGLVNEWYLEDLSENIRMVLDQKRREGKYIGGFAAYGYRKDPADRNRLVVDPEAAAVVRQIFRWSLEGFGRQRIAAMLNDQGVPNPARYKAERGLGRPGAEGRGLWNKTTVWRILRSELYTGVMVQGRRRKVSYKSPAIVDVPRERWYRVEGTHEAIIDRETFRAVQRELDLRARSDGSGEAYPLAGLVRCMDCGGAMSRTTSRRDGRSGASYLRCSLYADSGRQKRCTRHAIRLDRLLALVTERIRRHTDACSPQEALARAGKEAGRGTELERERRELSAQLCKRTLALEQLYLDRTSGVLSQTQFAELSRTFQAERTRMERRLRWIGEELSARNASAGLDLTERAQTLLRLDTAPRELAAALIEKIEIGEKDPISGRQEVRIHWRF